MDSETGSIHELLELIRHLKQQTNPQSKSKELSSLSFSEKYQSSDPNHRPPLGKLQLDYNLPSHNSTNKSIGNSTLNRQSIFDKLYHEGKEMEQRKCRLEYQTRKSKEQKEQSECTFSPNITNAKAKQRMRTEYDSVEQNDSFYVKNMQWLERKEKSIKVMQCQKNEGSVNQLTFTPRIKKYKRKQREERQVTSKKGVKEHLYRQGKAKQLQTQVNEKKEKPYMHIWNVKGKGQFSYIK